MNKALPQPQLRQSPYRLSENLRDELGMLGSYPGILCDGDHDDLLFSKLGHTGWGRLHHFHRYYSAGWGDGSGKPLSPRAMETLSRFLETAEFPHNVRPSVFLTREGFIELCWEDAAGK